MKHNQGDVEDACANKHAFLTNNETYSWHNTRPVEAQIELQSIHWRKEETQGTTNSMSFILKQHMKEYILLNHKFI